MDHQLSLAYFTQLDGKEYCYGGTRRTR